MSHRYEGHSFKTPELAMKAGVCPECEQPVEPGRGAAHAAGHWPDVIPVRSDTVEARERKALLLAYDRKS